MDGSEAHEDVHMEPNQEVFEAAVVPSSYLDLPIRPPPLAPASAS